MSEYKVTYDDLAAFNSLMKEGGVNGYAYRTGIIDQLFPMDPETGLPSLPEGYFWRVFKYIGTPYIGLFYRQETYIPAGPIALFFNKKAKGRTEVEVRKIEDRHVDRAIGDPVVALFDAATNLLSALPQHLRREVNPVDYKSYYGDYPPKNIHTAES